MNISIEQKDCGKSKMIEITTHCGNKISISISETEDKVTLSSETGQGMTITPSASSQIICQMKKN